MAELLFYRNVTWNSRVRRVFYLNLQKFINIYKMPIQSQER